MAGDALRRLAVSLVEMMARAIVGGGLMALGAQRITLGAQATAVGLMAIRAGHSGLVHFAL
jgi:hypothetical protein